MAFEEIEYFPGMEIGKGFDTLSEDIKITPAVRGRISPPDHADGQTGTFNVIIVQGTKQFEEALDINVSVGGGFGPFRASAKTKFMNKCKVSSQALHCIVSFDATNAFESFDNVELTEDAEELLKLNKTQRFKDRFGDRFISGRYTGGQFFGSIRIESESYERQESLAVEVKAKLGAFFSAKANVDESSKISISSKEIEILTFQTGGEVIPVFSFKQLLEQSVRVSKAIANGGSVPISFTLDDYAELELPNDDISFVDQENQRQVKRKLTEYRKNLLELQQDIDYVLRNQDFFILTNNIINDLNSDNKEITKNLNLISDHMNACVRDPANCNFFTPTIPRIQIPPRKKKSSSTLVNAHPFLPGRVKRLELKLATLKKTLSKVDSRKIRIVNSLKLEITNLEKQITSLKKLLPR